ncbi:OmpP1/FadL family transporter [Azohydromonas aeria]|uniref:OmpP1/FadL family transporter n=1 Tax=Azohydromonas aeria TaxID=2590212 RepID=UPI0012FC1573|nr:outer membrane protein transport protein [Azohydromonas aeria]
MTRISTPARPYSSRLKAVPAALLGLLGCSLAQAAGFQLLEQNASGIANAYAGSAAATDNASTIFFNPAGMTELRDREVSLGGSVVDISAKFRDNGSQVGALAAAGNGGNAGTTNFVPNAYLSWKLSPQLWAGIGVSAPFGLKTEYGNPWVGGAHALHFDVKTININPSLAFKVNDTLSLGAGVSYQLLDADYLRLASVATPGLAASTVSFKADDWSLGWNVGLLYKPSPDTRVGLSYRSAIKHTVSGDLKAGGLAGGVLAPAVNGPAYARIKLPDTVLLSLAQRVNPQWELLGDLSWTGWDSIQDVDIRRSGPTAANPDAANGPPAQTLKANFRNSWRMALGANYTLDSAWTLKGGLAYDRTPVRGPSTTLVSLPDGNRLWLTAGAQWRLSPDSRIDFGVAYIRVKDPKIDNDEVALGRGRVTGSYDNRIWILGAQYSQSF